MSLKCKPPESPSLPPSPPLPQARIIILCIYANVSLQLKFAKECVCKENWKSLSSTNLNSLSDTMSGIKRVGNKITKPLITMMRNYNGGVSNLMMRFTDADESLD